MLPRYNLKEQSFLPYRRCKSSDKFSSNKNISRLLIYFNTNNLLRTRKYINFAPVISKHIVISASERIYIPPTSPYWLHSLAALFFGGWQCSERLPSYTRKTMNQTRYLGECHTESKGWAWTAAQSSNGTWNQVSSHDHANGEPIDGGTHEGVW